MKLHNFFGCFERESLRQDIVLHSDWGPGLCHYLSTTLPKKMAHINEIEFIALDFEMTGLDPNKDKILSIGLVPFTLEGIELSQAQERLICHGMYVKPESAQVNQLTPKMLSFGVSIYDAMNELFFRLAGKVILAHNACIEQQFIESYLMKYCNLTSFPAYFIDTLNIEKCFSYEGRSKGRKSYQLDDLRACYGLPHYCSHSAASDALACAELFIVQYKKLLSRDDLLLKDVCR